jgi:outer membrane protein assembly factor BamA
VFTIERRYFSDIHIFNLLRLGAVVFFDMGKAWGLEQYGNSPTLSNVGIGLRLSSSKVKIGNVVHIDVATPTSAKNGLDKYQLTIGAQQKF